MAKYVTRGQFTDQGIRGLKDSPTRLKAGIQRVESAGMKVPGVTRRQVLAAGIGSIVGACSGGSKMPTAPTVAVIPATPASPNPTPAPLPTIRPFVEVDAPLTGLLYDTPGNGRVVIPGKPELMFKGGLLRIEKRHELTVGDRHNDVDVFPEVGVGRRTSVDVLEDGLYVQNGNNELVRLDYVEDPDIFAKYMKIRFEFDPRVDGLHRISSLTRGKLKPFFYDRSTWRLRDNRLEQTQDNTPVRGDIDEAVTSVVHRDFEIYSDGRIPNGGLIRESQSSIRPVYGDDGFIIYMACTNDLGWAVAQLSNGSVLAHPGDITSARLLINPAPNHNFSGNGRSAVSVDTFESFGANNYDGRNGYLPTDFDGNPTQESRLISKIRFRRLPLNRTLLLPNGELILDFQK